MSDDRLKDILNRIAEAKKTKTNDQPRLRPQNVATPGLAPAGSVGTDHLAGQEALNRQINEIKQNQPDTSRNLEKGGLTRVFNRKSF